MHSAASTMLARPRVCLQMTNSRNWAVVPRQNKGTWAQRGKVRRRDCAARTRTHAHYTIHIIQRVEGEAAARTFESDQSTCTCRACSDTLCICRDSPVCVRDEYTCMHEGRTEDSMHAFVQYVVRVFAVSCAPACKEIYIYTGHMYGSAFIA